MISDPLMHPEVGKDCLPWLFTSLSLFNIQSDHDSSHDIVQLKVFSRACGIRVVAIDATLSDCEIGVDGLEIVLSSYFGYSDIRTGM